MSFQVRQVTTCFVLSLKEHVAFAAISVPLSDLDMSSERGGNTILCQSQDLPRDIGLLCSRARSGTPVRLTQRSPLFFLQVYI